MKHIRLGAMFCGLVIAAACTAQQPPFLDAERHPAYGAYADMNINWHTADFRALPGVPNCCPDFQSGSGIGAAFGLLYEHPISNLFSWQLRAGYSWDGATLTATEGTTVIVGGAAVPGQFTHTVSVSVNTFGVEPYIKLNARRFSAQVGFRAAYAFNQTYNQKEELTQPSDVGTFENGQRTRNVYSGTLPSATSFHAGIMTGVSYEVPMNKKGTLFAAPELQVGFGVTPLVSGLTWNANVVRVGIAVKYVPNDDEAPPVNSSESESSSPPPPSPAANPAPAPAPSLAPLPPGKLAARVAAVGVDPNGTVHPDATIRVEQFRSLQIRPLLNYVFFDQDSSGIPPRYARLDPQEAKAFSVDNLHNLPTLQIYYQILNIIGRRMRENPKAVITVTGCNDGIGGEKGNMYLSRMRAQSVRDYLATTWNIPYSRMRLEERDLPADSSDPSTNDGVQENRRVEINSNDWAIVQPVITHDTVVRISPSLIRFRTTVVAPNGVDGWALRAGEHDSTLKAFSGAAAVPPILEWDLQGGQTYQAFLTEPVHYVLSVQDSTGKADTSPENTIPVKLVTIDQKRGTRVSDKEIDHYSLILFKFDKADLSTTNQRIVKLIKEYITPDATVSVTGYTDRIGDPQHNKDLSASRAQMTAAALGVPVDQAEGVGEADLFNNDIPEGRFYCRTVDITVIRPVHD